MAVARGIREHPLLRGLGRCARTVLDLLLPGQCLACGTLVEEPGAVCAGCWAKLAFIAPPLCDGCGTPFPVAAEGGGLCLACHRRPRPFARARAALVYGDGSRGLILALKHADRTDGVRTFGRWMVQAGAPLLADAELIAPVPLHWTRLVRRRYNQAALLALAVGRLGCRPVVPDLLVRHRRTQMLGRLGARERRQTVAGAFALARRHRAAVAGRRVLLIDDVFTTGATIEGCTRELLAAGAAAVDVLTLARVVRPAL